MHGRVVCGTYGLVSHFFYELPGEQHGTCFILGEHHWWKVVAVNNKIAGACF